MKTMKHITKLVTQLQPQIKADLVKEVRFHSGNLCTVEHYELTPEDPTKIVSESIYHPNGTFQVGQPKLVKVTFVLPA